MRLSSLYCHRYNFLHAQPPTLPAHRVHTVHYDVVHRIAVFDSAAHADNGGGLDIIGVLSQSDVIAFLQVRSTLFRLKSSVSRFTVQLALPGAAAQGA